MPGDTSTGEGGRAFPTTDWTQVLEAREFGGAPLQALFRDYWKPVYHYFRRRGLAVEDAKDAVQGVFTAILERHALDAADPTRGRFRTFVRMLASRWQADRADHERAQKRGGDWNRVPLDVADPPDLAAPPERAFLRDWAQETVRRALDRLRAEIEPAHFEVFMDYYRREGTYAAVAERRGVSTSDVTNWLHQARLKLRDFLLVEVRRGVASDAEVDSEIRDLLDGLDNS